MYRNAPADAIRILERERVTANFHTNCVTPKKHGRNSKLRNFYRILSTNTDKKGIQFVSSMEGKEKDRKKNEKIVSIFQFVLLIPLYLSL